MDYFVVLLLLIIIFTFMSDKKIISLTQIQNKIENINELIEQIYNETIVVDVERNNRNGINSIKDIIKQQRVNSENNDNIKYIMIKDKSIKLDDEKKKLLIANYINVKMKPSFFRGSYEYKYVNNKRLEDLKNELYLAIFNYINIFEKQNLNTNGVIVIKQSELNKILNKNERGTVFFSASEELKIEENILSKEELVEEIKTIYNSDIKVLIKSLLLIFVGITVVANLLHAIYILNLTQIIIAVIIYWCYNYVLTYMYKPIGKYKIFVKYLLPVFLMFYMILLLVNFIRKNIGIK